MISERFCSLRLSMILAVTLAVVCGCEERDIPPIRDDDAIRRYISTHEEGIDLFRSAGLITDDPYTLPYDDAVYRDFVDTTWRELDVFIDTSRTYDFGAMGRHYIATVRVIDRFLTTTLRIVETQIGPDTAQILGEREIYRYGYFIKLGDDSKPFLGWKLWGFNSLGQSEVAVRLSVKTTDGTHTLAATMAQYTYEGPGTSMQFVLLSDIDALRPGDTLVFSLSPRDDRDSDYYYLTAGATNAGQVTQAMDRIDNLHWVDTIVTPSPNPRLWNIVFVQSFKKPYSFEYTRGWCIPYRVPDQ